MFEFTQIIYKSVKSYAFHPILLVINYSIAVYLSGIRSYFPSFCCRVYPRVLFRNLTGSKTKQYIGQQHERELSREQNKSVKTQGEWGAIHPRHYLYCVFYDRACRPFRFCSTKAEVHSLSYEHHWPSCPGASVYAVNFELRWKSRLLHERTAYHWNHVCITYCSNVSNISFSETLPGVKNLSVCVKGKSARTSHACNFSYYRDVDIFLLDLLCRAA